jgi:hypothetical protein
MNNAASAAKTLVARPPLRNRMSWRSNCRRLRQRGEQVLASALPANEMLQIKHFLAAILLCVFELCFG